MRPQPIYGSSSERSGCPRLTQSRSSFRDSEVQASPSLEQYRTAEGLCTTQSVTAPTQRRSWASSNPYWEWTRSAAITLSGDGQLQSSPQQQALRIPDPEGRHHPVLACWAFRIESDRESVGHSKTKVEQPPPRAERNDYTQLGVQGDPRHLEVDSGVHCAKPG